MAVIDAVHSRLALTVCGLMAVILAACNDTGPAAPQALECADAIAVRVAGTGKCLKPGDTFRDSALAPEMVIIPAGAFEFAGPDGTGGGNEGEGAGLEVAIAQPFAAARTEITFEHWQACTEAGVCSGDKRSDHGWLRSDRAIIDLSWGQVRGYLDWLSRETGEEYRRLTEVEWEYAARTGAARDFGLDHLRGTNWEWVGDCRQTEFEPRQGDGSRFNQGNCLRRVRRGGPWREAYRYDTSAPITYAYAGLRIARNLSR